MLGKRPLNLDDYLAMLKRRKWLIIIPAVLAPAIGFLISYALTPKYTSQALVLVEGQKVPEGYVKPVITTDITQRVATIQQQILSRRRLVPIVERLGLAKNAQETDDIVDDIRQNLSIEPVQAASVASTSTAGKKKKKGPSSASASQIPGFYVKYTGDNPRQAQQICAALTSALLEENLQAREQFAQGASDFIVRQLGEAKQSLDDLDNKMAGFKQQYSGRLPSDQDGNLKVLMTLNSQLEANTQTLNRARQDKTYAESVLAQQISAWKSSQTSLNPQTLEQQIANLQSQLVTLESRYTDDHPDVIKAKNDIADLKKKLDDANAQQAQTPGDTNVAATNSEPAEVKRVRLQLRQYDALIAQSTTEQKRLQDQIGLYQGRVAVSPGVEEQYKALTRDYETAQRVYNDLLIKKSQSEMQTDMERAQQGEQMRLLNPANAPDSPSFPTRWMFAAGGLGVGLALGFTIALLLEFRDNAIRNERDAQAALDLPTLAALPWVGMDGKDKKRRGRLPALGSGKPIEV
jgi:uncharacterized protein involved in exopolysaccharide biosynthesis